MVRELKSKSNLAALIAALLGLAAFVLALHGQAVAPCPDWGFHLCYASTLDAAACNAGYSFYAPLLHLAVSSAPELLFAVLVGLLTALLALALFKRGGVFGIAAYFLAIPAFLVFVLQKPSYLWFSMVFCGVLPWLFVSTLGFLFLLYFEELGFWSGALVAAAVISAHNYGLFLFAGLAVVILFAKTVSRVTSASPVVARCAVLLAGVALLNWLGFFGFGGVFVRHAAARLVVFSYLAVSVLGGVFLKNGSFKNPPCVKGSAPRERELSKLGE